MNKVILHHEVQLTIRTITRLKVFHICKFSLQNLFFLNFLGNNGNCDNSNPSPPTVEMGRDLNKGHCGSNVMSFICRLKVNIYTKILQHTRLYLFERGEEILVQ